MVCALQWARLRSHRPPDPLKLPDLSRTENDEPIAHTHTEKTQLLAERFFPSPEADLSDIEDTTWDDRTFGDSFEINRKVTADEIQGIIRHTGAWKAPG